MPVKDKLEQEMHCVGQLFIHRVHDLRVDFRADLPALETVRSALGIRVSLTKTYSSQDYRGVGFCGCHGKCSIDRCTLSNGNGNAP